MIMRSLQKSVNNDCIWTESKEHVNPETAMTFYLPTAKQVQNISAHHLSYSGFIYLYNRADCMSHYVSDRASLSYSWGKEVMMNLAEEWKR